MGGVRWQGHLYLKHGPDLRRIILLLVGFFYFLLPQTRQKSFILKGAQKFFEALMIPRFRWCFALSALGVSLALSVLQAFSLRTTLYDVGIFHQILWSLSQGLGFHSTISGAGDFLSDHFSPSLALLVPLFVIFKKSPLFLPVLQPILLFGGGLSWIFLASKIEGISEEYRKKWLRALTLILFSFESFWGNLKWGFHENAIAFCCLSWAFALVLGEGRAWPHQKWRTRFIAFVLLLIAAGSKEILLLDVSFFFMVWAVFLVHTKAQKKESLLFSLLLVLSAFGLLYFFIRFENLGHPIDKNYFLRYYSYLGNNLTDFFRTLIQDPRIVIRTVGAWELIKYGITLFSPWLFIPLILIRKNLISLSWFLVALPSLGSAALATYLPLRRSEFHYVLEIYRKQYGRGIILESRCIKL